VRFINPVRRCHHLCDIRFGTHMLDLGQNLNHQILMGMIISESHNNYTN